MIYKVKDFDLLATSIVPNNYYFCTDTKCLYKDTKSGRFRISVDFINTELDRVHNVRPEMVNNIMCMKQMSYGYTILDGYS